jgi:uncharacterized phage protein (TIGR02220 family)
LAEQETHYNMTIPDYICEAKDLTPLEKIVFGYIYSLAYHNEICWATDKYISVLLSYSDRQIRSAITTLKNKDFINISYEYYPNTKNIKHRQIRINNTYRQVRKCTSAGCGNILPQGMEVDFQKVRKCTSTNNIKDNINNNVEQDSTSYISQIKEIIDYLNLKIGTSYKASTKVTQKHIKARLKEGYTVDDFKKVIDRKTEEWQNTDMSKYLRPDTLFGAKFESYLNVPLQQNTEKTDPFRRYDVLN